MAKKSKTECACKPPRIIHRGICTNCKLPVITKTVLVFQGEEYELK